MSSPLSEIAHAARCLFVRPNITVLAEKHKVSNRLWPQALEIAQKVLRKTFGMELVVLRKAGKAGEADDDDDTGGPAKKKKGKGKERAGDEDEEEEEAEDGKRKKKGQRPLPLRAGHSPASSSHMWTAR